MQIKKTKAFAYSVFRGINIYAAGKYDLALTIEECHRSIRVLFWSELFWPYIGGAEIFATKLIPALQERGHEFIVVTRQDSPDLSTSSDKSGETQV